MKPVDEAGSIGDTSTTLPARVRSIEEWLALGELEMGDHELSAVNIFVTDAASVRRNKIPGAPSADVAPDAKPFALPTVALRGKYLARRLPLEFTPVVVRIYRDAARAFANGERMFPALYRFRVDVKPARAAVLVALRN
jgi:hypothetical protein